MKILFISDIHANYEALLTLESCIDSVAQTICLGDIVGYHCLVNETIEFLKKYDVKCIQGNHDRYLFEGYLNQTKEMNDSVKFGIDQAAKRITPENKAWLKDLPISIGLEIDKLNILCCHGSPWDPINGYVYADSLSFPKMNDFKYDIIGLGHTHRHFVKENLDQIVFNPGSVGQSRDREGKVCAKIFDTDSKLFQDICLDYEFHKTLEHSVSCGAESWIYKHFETVM